MAPFNFRRCNRQQETITKTECYKSIIPTIPTAKFRPKEAEKIARMVGTHVDNIRSSSALFGDSKSKSHTYGLFHRNEIQAGRCLGSGSFCDVYEIQGFTPSSSTGYTKRQAFSRHFYSTTAQRDDGESRYVMKHLKTKLMEYPESFRMAACDLAMEAQFLSSLEHPHILKIRGWSVDAAAGYKDGSHDGFFLILDRLEGDLEGQIKQWKKEQKQLRRWNRNKLSRRKALAERVKAAYQIACALDYLHEQGIIFRDLKPANVGFDADGNVKLFDFGMAREMPPEAGETDEVFNMSGRLGTSRYMAPEVALCQKYNLKADVYSWACNFYEMLALQKPYALDNEEKHMQHCCKDGFRPVIRREWPQSIKDLLKKSWNQDLSARSTMKQVVESLKSILLGLLDAVNTDVLTIRERREQSVILELPADFDTSMAFNTAAKRVGCDVVSMDTTSPESLRDSLDNNIGLEC